MPVVVLVEKCQLEQRRAEQDESKIGANNSTIRSNTRDSSFMGIKKDVNKIIISIAEVLSNMEVQANSALSYKLPSLIYWLKTTQ